MSMEITQYAPNAGGARAVQAEAEPGIQVFVQPADKEFNDRAVEIARTLHASFRIAATLRTKVKTLEDRLQNAQAQLRAAEAQRDAAIIGRRRFFGPVLMSPAVAGDWSGAVWLLDPEKGDRGRGLRFASVAEVHREHPELWIVGHTPDGVLLDAWGQAGIP